MSNDLVRERNPQSLLAPSESKDVFGDLGLSLLQSGLTDPLRAVAQIVDKASGNYLNLESTIIGLSKKVGLEAVKPAEFSTPSWYAQQLGAAVGMMGPYLLARGTVKFGANKVFGERALLDIHADGLRSAIASKQMAKSAASEAALSGASGFLYGLTFVPSESPTNSTPFFIIERTHHALYDAAAFGAIGAVGPFVGRAIGKLSTGIENASIGKYGNYKLQEYEVRPAFADAFKQVQGHLSTGLRSPVLNGVVSGIPIGLINAQVGAFKSGNLFPESKDVKENVLAMMFVGGALASANRLASRKELHESRSQFNIRNGGLADFRYEETKLKSATYAERSVREQWTLASDRYVGGLRETNRTERASHREQIELSALERVRAWNATEIQAQSQRLRDLDFGSQVLLSSVWSKLTDHQKNNLSVTELLRQSRVIDELRLDGRQSAHLATAPEFVDWHIANKFDLFGRVKDYGQVMETWINHPEWRTASPEQISIFANLPSELKLEPHTKVLREVQIAAELGLSPQQISRLRKEGGDFIEWLEAHRRSLYRDLTAQEYKDNLRGTLFAWSEIHSYASELRPVELARLGAVWKDLTKEQRAQGVPFVTGLAELASRLQLEASQIGKVDAAFVDWCTRNPPASRREFEQTKELLDKWLLLSAEQRSLEREDVYALSSLSPEVIALGRPALDAYIEVAKGLDLTAAFGKELNSDFLIWFTSYKSQLFSLPRESRHSMSAILKVWNDLTLELRKLPPNELRSIAEVWSVLNKVQRKSSIDDLLALSKLNKQYHLRESDVKALSPDFIAKFKEMEAKWSTNHNWPPDLFSLAIAWPEFSARHKTMSDRDLIVTARAWKKLTPEQKQLSPDEIKEVASLISRLHLTGTQAAQLQNAPGFIDWFKKREADRRGFDYELESVSAKVLEFWNELTPEMLRLSAKEITPVINAWSRLTPEHKLLSMKDLIPQASVIHDLRMSVTEIALLSKNRDFAKWYWENRNGSGGAPLDSMGNSWPLKFFRSWSDLPTDRTGFSFKEAQSVINVWDKLSDVQRKLPRASLVTHAEIVQSLGLDAHLSKIVADNRDYVEFYKERLAPEIRLDGIAKEYQQILISIWPELNRETKSLDLSSLREIARAWNQLSETQKQQSASQIVKLSKLVNILQLEKTELAKLGNLSSFLEWSERRSFNLFSEYSLRDSVKHIVRTWSKLTETESKQFEKWLDANLRGSDASSAPSSGKLSLLNPIIENWEYLSKAERELGAGALVEKARLLHGLTLGNQQPTIGPRVPEAIVQSITDAKPWRQIAALASWRDLLFHSRFHEQIEGGKTIPDADWHSFISSKELVPSFEKRLQEKLATGRARILEESSDAVKLVRNYHPSMGPVLTDIIKRSLLHSNNPNAYVQRLNPKDFKAVLAYLFKSPDKVEQLARMDLVEATDNPLYSSIVRGLTWEVDSALKLLTIFGPRWQTVNGQPGWLELQQKLGRNAHDATSWLSLVPKDSAESLASFLMRFSDRDPGELGVVAKRWHNLTPEQRSASYKEVLAASMSMKYENVKEAELAIEAAKWGVAQQEFSTIESRFLRSLDVPSPFPVNKVWSAGDLSARFVPRDDPRGLFLGRHTDCCQHPSGSGREAAWMGQERSNAGFFVVEDRKKVIVAQSLAWETDNGGLVFDSIEGKGLSGRAQKVAELYEAAAKDLRRKYHTINVGVDSAAGKAITGSAQWPTVARQNLLQLPFDYGGYTDARNNQLQLAHNPDVKVLEQPSKPVWIRGAGQSDLPAAQNIINQVYPEGWRFIPHGDWHRVMEARGIGIIGGYVLDVRNRSVNEAFVHPDFRNRSAMLFSDMLRKISHEGGEWSANLRESTSYKLFRKAAELKWLTINEEIKRPGQMPGEHMFDVRFTVNSAAPAR